MPAMPDVVNDSATSSSDDLRRNGFRATAAAGTPPSGGPLRSDCRTRRRGRSCPRCGRSRRAGRGYDPTRVLESTPSRRARRRKIVAIAGMSSADGVSEVRLHLCCIVPPAARTIGDMTTADPADGAVEARAGRGCRRACRRTPTCRTPRFPVGAAVRTRSGQRVRRVQCRECRLPRGSVRRGGRDRRDGVGRASARSTRSSRCATAMSCSTPLRWLPAEDPGVRRLPTRWSTPPARTVCAPRIRWLELLPDSFGPENLLD